MKRSESAIRDRLHLYVEARMGRADALSLEEREVIEACLERDPDLRQEAHWIEEHLRLLREAKRPIPATELAVRCLNRIHDDRTRSIRWIWAPAYTAAALVLVFVGGLWLGGVVSRSPQQDIFHTLMTQQTQLVVDIEALLASRHDGTLWAAQLANFSESSHAIASQFEAYRGDPIVEQRLNAVLYNNILLLESIRQDLQRGDALPERQMLQVKPNASRAI